MFQTVTRCLFTALVAALFPALAAAGPPNVLFIAVTGLRPTPARFRT